MTVINYATGEIVDYDAAAAERRAERIITRLDAIAENYSRVLPMIREAIEKRDDIALGYRSPGEYVADRFGQSLAGLGVEVRRAVVGELTEAGMSTRAIAPVVGVTRQQVSKDIHSGGNSVATFQSPESVTGGEASVDSGQTPQGEVAPVSSPSDPVPSPTKPRPAVTGIDGKTYSRPEPKATPKADPEYDNAAQACLGLTRAMSRLLTFEHPNMRAGMRAYWSLASAEVPPVQRQDVTPELMRAAARGLLELADEWESQ